jgi:hypothetical protein
MRTRAIVTSNQQLPARDVALFSALSFLMSYVVLASAARLKPSSAAACAALVDLNWQDAGQCKTLGYPQMETDLYIKEKKFSITFNWVQPLLRSLSQDDYPAPEQLLSSGVLQRLKAAECRCLPLRTRPLRSADMYQLINRANSLSCRLV